MGTYRNLLLIFAPPAIVVPEGHILGWRVVGRDFRSRGGYRWPWPGGAAETPDARPGGPCPSFEGDGLCLALSARGAAQGGICLECVLLTAHRVGDVLGQDEDKVRVRRALVLDLVDAQAMLRVAGQGADLAGANLRGADLRGADLAGADLAGADLRWANLWWADLAGANLRGADLRGADLAGADFAGADLRGADLWGADLAGDQRGDGHRIFSRPLDGWNRAARPGAWGGLFSHRARGLRGDEK